MSKLENMFEEHFKEENLEADKTEDVVVEEEEEEEVIEEVVEEKEEKEEETTEEKEEEIVAEEEETTEKEEKEEFIIGETEEEASEDNKNEITEEAFFEFASKKLNKKIESLDDLVVSNEPTIGDEQLQVVQKFMKDTGRDIFDWVKMQSLSVDTLDSEQLVKKQMEVDYPMLTPSQIERRFSNKYKLDTEQYTPEEVEDAKTSLLIDSEDAKKKLKVVSEGYLAPVAEPNKVDTKAIEQENQRIKDEFVKQMVQEVDKISTFDYEVDNSVVKYKPSKEDISMIKDMNQNLEVFWERFKKPDGTFDFEALSSAMYFSDKNNVSKFVKAVKGRFINEGTAKNVKRQKNTKLPDADVKSAGKSAAQKKIEDDFARTISQETGAKPKMKIKRF